MKWRIARAIFAVAAVILLIRLVPPADVLGVLAGCSPGWLIVAAILLAASTMLGTISFRRLLAARSVNARFGAVLATDLAGHFYALSLPGGVVIGGAMRLLRLSGPRVSMASVLSAIIASRLLDIVCGVLVAIAAIDEQCLQPLEAVDRALGQHQRVMRQPFGPSIGNQLSRLRVAG